MKRVIIEFCEHSAVNEWTLGEDEIEGFLPIIDGDLLRIYDKPGRAMRYYHWSDIKAIHILDEKDVKK